MSLNKKLLWGGLGWAFGGPIGAIFGYAIASMSNDKAQQLNSNNKFGRGQVSTKPADFVISILVLFAKVMKADGQLLKSEIAYVKQFLKQQFGVQQARELMPILKDILDQDYPLKDVCKQIQRSMDHPSRLQLIHVLFGLSAADGDVHPDEVSIILTISNYLNINRNDFESIKAMFSEDKESELPASWRIVSMKEILCGDIKKHVDMQCQDVKSYDDLRSTIMKWAVAKRSQLCLHLEK